MNRGLPKVTHAGLFNSRIFFPESTITEWRTVNQYELELYAENSGVTYLNDHHYPIKHGSILLAKPGDKRRTQLPFTAYYIHFRSDNPTVEALAAQLSGYTYGDFDDALLEPLKKLWKSYSISSEYQEIKLAQQLLDILLTLNKAIKESQSTRFSPEETIYTKATRYMKNHYREPITITEIAKHCNLSVSQLYRNFMHNSGKPAKVYLTNLRLAEAKRLLISTNTDISMIAEQCGFTTHAHFSYTFTQAENMSPTEYRKKMGYKL